MGEETNHTRRRALQTIGSVVVAGFAGCNSSRSSDPAQQPTDTPTATPTSRPTETSTETPTDEPTSTEHTHEHSTAEPPESVQFVENPKEVHPTLVEKTSVPSDEVLIGFRLEDSSLPFTTEVYHAPDDAEIQATKTYDTQDLGQVDLVPEPHRRSTPSTPTGKTSITGRRPSVSHWRSPSSHATTVRPSTGALGIAPAIPMTVTTRRIPR